MDIPTDRYGARKVGPHPALARVDRQLLATAHGGSVAKAPQGEVGWVAIETDEPELVPDGPWFQWHFDRWQVPPGAREVARNEAASQGFVLRRNLAVQFHPELDSAMLRGWLDNGGSAVMARLGLDEAAIVAQTAALEDDSRARALRLVDAFIERFVDRQKIARPSEGSEAKNTF